MKFTTMNIKNERSNQGQQQIPFMQKRGEKIAIIMPTKKKVVKKEIATIHAKNRNGPTALQMGDKMG